MKYSIIIATKNGLEHTTKCLASVFSFTKDFEVVIVDGNSTDGTKGYLQEIKARNENIKVISLSEEKTFAQANNIGLTQAEGEYIVFLNNDTIVNDGWIDKLEEHFRNIPLDNLGMVGPVSNCSNGKQAVGVQDPRAWYEANKGRWSHVGRLYGWCMFTRKDILDKIGGFDEKFVNSHEDNDLCLRFQLAGYQLAVAYDTYITHTGQGTLRSVFTTAQYLENGHLMREAYYDKWYDPKPKKLVAVYRTNGGVWLEESIKQISKCADSIIIHFCRAPKEFSKMYPSEKGSGLLNREEYIKYLTAKFSKIVKVQFYDGIFQEDYERGWLLEEALKLQAESLADWCISIDDDEIYEDKFIEQVQRYMSPRNPEIFGYSYQWRTIWSKVYGDEYYRTDSTFGQFMNYRFFRLISGQKITSRHPEGHHCGSAPHIAIDNLAWANFRVKHLGYDTPEQRMRKFEFYQANDHFKDRRDIGNDDYSHLIDINVQLEKYQEKIGISLVSMIKNEEDQIIPFLENIEPLVDEIIIADTGSTDKTLELIEKFAKYSRVPVKVFHFPWCDNYSMPRNFAKSKATQPWILMMDADERFEHEDLEKIFKTAESNVDVVVFHVINYLKKTLPGQTPVYASTEAARMFRNIPELYWTGIIHETVDDAMSAFVKKLGLIAVKSDVLLHHSGYLRGKDKVNKKLDYYVQLNEKQIEITEGKDPRPYFNLALHYLNNPETTKEALECFQKCLGINPRFWHANQQMAALNMKSAKEFLARTIDTAPEDHPFKKEAAEILNFLESHSTGTIEVGKE